MQDEELVLIVAKLCKFKNNSFTLIYFMRKFIWLKLSRTQNSGEDSLYYSYSVDTNVDLIV